MDALILKRLRRVEPITDQKLPNRAYQAMSVLRPIADIPDWELRAITGRDLWWIKIQLACSVSACSGVTVAGLRNRL